MKFILKIIAPIFVILLVGCANLSVYEANQFQIQFGLLQQNEDGSHSVTETNEIPYILGRKNQRFGYLITPNHNDLYKYQASIVMPSNPIFVEGHVTTPKNKASTDGLKSIKVVRRGPQIMDMWLNIGDPKGEYHATLFINGQVADKRAFNAN